jgi:hypothetical protein
LNCGATTEWNALLAVQAEAAATLTGLVFVAVSLNLDKVLTVPGVSGRAAESVLQLLEVFFISTVALIPRQSATMMAIEFLAIGLVFWTAQSIGHVRYLRSRSGHPWSWFLYRTVLGQLATIPFVVAALCLLAGICNGIYWLVPGFVFSFAAAMVSAWVLLVEILR